MVIKLKWGKALMAISGEPFLRLPLARSKKYTITLKHISCQKITLEQKKFTRNILSLLIRPNMLSDRCFQLGIDTNIWQESAKLPTGIKNAAKVLFVCF